MKQIVAILLAFALPLAAADVAEMDQILARHFHRADLKPNAPVSDEVFVRRVHLDVIGRIPTAHETLAFLQSQAPDKRARLIDSLLASEGYVHHFYNVWADILRLQTASLHTSAVAAGAYMRFIKDSLRGNKPYDQFVRELITADRPAWESGALGYHIRDGGMRLDAMALTARIFLGTRIECAQCHDHPFDKWKQLEFYRLAAYTNQVDETAIFERIGLSDELGRRQKRIDEQYRNERSTLGEAGAKLRRDAAYEATANPHKVLRVLREISNPFTSNTELRHDPRRELKLPHDYQYPNGKPGDVIAPAPLFGEAPPAPASLRRDQLFALWLTSPENPRFTKVIVNRLMRQLFGHALIEPLDDMRDDSKASIPELQEYLERKMIALRYDMRAFLALVLRTRAYQSECNTAEAVPGEPFHFTGPLLRRMTAEQIWDSCIALMRPDPDARNEQQHTQQQQRLARAVKALAAFQAIPIDQLCTMGMDASAAFGSATQRIQQIQAQIDEARRAGNDEKTAQLAKDLLKAGNTSATIIDAVFYPMLAALAQQRGSTIPPRESLPNNIRFFMDAFTIPGFDIPVPSKEEEKAAFAMRAAHWLSLANTSGLSPSEQEQFARHHDSGRHEWVRAAELDSPAPRGHFLRELGQSDRDLVENGNLDASVPQALLFMNSALVPRIFSRWSPVMLRMRTSANDGDKLDALCLALFSRKATQQERAAMKSASEKARKPEAMIHTLLNTQQFLFIQ